MGLFKKKPPKTSPILSEDDAFINDSKAALLDKSTPFANIVLYSILVLLIIGLVWAFFSNIEEVTIGEGKVISSSQNKVIQSLDGGTLRKLFVREGQKVKQGDILLVLDETRYKSDYEAALEKYRALLALTARLTAETQHKDSIDFPKEIKDLTDLTVRENKLFESRKEALKAKLAILEKSLDLSRKEIEILKPLVAKGFAPQLDLVRAERNANDIIGKIQEAKDKFSEDALQALNTHKAEMEEIQKSLASLSDKMHDTTLYSPVTGIIKKINIVTLGGVITPGMNIMEIVPLNEGLLIETKVRPLDIAFVHPGQKATVKITAYDYTIYGTLTGHVESISADTIEEEKSKATFALSFISPDFGPS